MSPIGRVFIVLNLVLAGTFVGFAGTYLQKQDDFKKQFTAEKASRVKDNELNQARIQQLESERNTLDTQKTTFENQLASANNQIARLQDDNKRLSELTSAQSVDLKRLASISEQIKTEYKAAFDQSQAAYQASIKADNERNSANNEKDAALAENRTLKTTIASLNERIGEIDQQMAMLQRDNSELGLLVKAAEANGFVPGMAAPNLAGTVTNASGRLCTIAISDNPGDVDIADMIEKRSFAFAIYDASGYKGEAVATKYEPSANAVLCKLFLVKDGATVREGDRAATKTP